MSNLRYRSTWENGRMAAAKVRDDFLDGSLKHRDAQMKYVLCEWSDYDSASSLKSKRPMADRLKYRSEIAEIESSKEYWNLIRACEMYDLQYRIEVQESYTHHCEYNVYVSFNAAALSNEQKEAANLKLQHDIEQRQERILQRVMPLVQEMEEKHADLLDSIVSALWETISNPVLRRLISAETLQNDPYTETMRQAFQYNIFRDYISFYDGGKDRYRFVYGMYYFETIRFHNIGMSDLPEEKRVPFTYALGRGLRSEFLKYYNSIGAEADVQIQTDEVDHFIGRIYMEIKNPFYKPLQSW